MPCFHNVPHPKEFVHAHTSGHESHKRTVGQPRELLSGNTECSAASSPRMQPQRGAVAAREPSGAFSQRQTVTGVNSSVVSTQPSFLSYSRQAIISTS